MFNDVRLKKDIHDIVYRTSVSEGTYSSSDNVVICCLVFQSLRQTYADKPYSKGTADGEIQSKYKLYRDFYNERKKKAYSYNELNQYVISTGVTNFTLLSSDMYQHILALYNRSTAIVNFSSAHFDVKMYKVASQDINIQAVRCLEVVHKNIMAPLARYYMVNNNAKESGINILSCRDNTSQPLGKVITFTHEFIPVAVMLRDIRGRRIRLPIEYAEKDGLNLKIVTKL